MTPEQKHSEVGEALENLGYKVRKGFHLEDLDRIRSRVVLGGEVIGIYDFSKHTFVD